MGWDVTHAASAHSALSGPLASVVLILIPLLRRDTSDVRYQQVSRLLVVAFLLLIMAAVIWGTLTGQPSAETVRSALKADGDSALASDRATAEIARNFQVGTVGVIMLAGGALALLAGLLDGITGLMSKAGVDRLYQVAAVALGGLSVYEVVFMYLSSVHAFGHIAGDRVNIVAIICGLTCLVLSTWAIRGFPNRPPMALLKAATWAVAASAGLALIAYIINPVTEPLDQPQPVTAWDRAGVWALGAAIPFFVIYAVTLAWFISQPVPRPAAKKKSSRQKQGRAKNAAAKKV